MSRMFSSVIRSTAFAACLGVAASFPLGASADDPAKGVGAAEAVQVKATVQSVDQKTRTVTLKGEDGKIVSLQVDPKVKTRQAQAG